MSHKSHCTLVQHQLSQGQAGFKIITEVESLEEIQTNILRVFLLAMYIVHCTVGCSDFDFFSHFEV